MRKFAFLFLSFTMLTGCDNMRVTGYQGPPSDHFKNGRFHNLVSFQRKSFWTILKWRWTSNRSPWPAWVESRPGPTPPAHVNDGTVRYVVVNHATVLIQVDGLNILTDPQWSERASPFTWIGPKRVRAPGLTFDQLPTIDVVLVSHNHYDHMDIPTLQHLQKRDQPLVVSGLGNAEFLKRFGIERAQDLDWWKSISVGSSTISFVPVQHFSQRGFGDAMKTLWGGFLVKSPHATIYFSGDTAYGSHFKMTKEKLGPIDLAFLPIGAYEPRWFMGRVHVNPEEAVQAHLDLGAKHSVAMHFGTFQMSDEAIDAPPKAVEAARQKLGVPLSSFQIPDFGQGYSFIKKK
jgi:L-ascorbate metabolism protein UlaG (beta-lactamase superfamily)